MRFLLSFIKGGSLKMWGWMAGITAGLVILAKIYSAGATGAKVQSLEDTLHSVKRRNEIENNVDGLSDADVTARLRDGGWIRDR